MNLTFFMTRSSLHSYSRSWENPVTVDFIEIIEFYQLKVGTYSWLSEYICCCLFGFNVAFNNFSVISRRYLVATGSSMLMVLPTWSISASRSPKRTLPTELSGPVKWVYEYILIPDVKVSVWPLSKVTQIYDFKHLLQTRQAHRSQISCRALIEQGYKSLFK